MAQVWHDAEIAERLSATAAVRWIGEAVDAHHRGELTAPPRVHTDLGDGRLVFTTGRLRGSWFGYRSYETMPGNPGAQVTVVHDESSGRVRAVAIGNELGPRRVGAIGAVAADALAPPGAAPGPSPSSAPGSRRIPRCGRWASCGNWARSGCIPGIRPAGRRSPSGCGRWQAGPATRPRTPGPRSTAPRS